MITVFDQSLSGTAVSPTHIPCTLEHRNLKRLLTSPLGHHLCRSLLKDGVGLDDLWPAPPPAPPVSLSATIRIPPLPPGSLVHLQSEGENL